MSKKLVPNIRFKGFDREWKESLLNEKLIPSREKNTQEAFSKDDVLSVSGDYGIVNQLKFKGRSFAGVSVAPYGVVHTNDVVYTKSPLKKQPYGIIKTNKGVDGIVSTLYAIYSCAKGVYPNFVEDYFNSDERLNSYLRPLVRKGAKNDMKISLEGALAGMVRFPEYEEQKMISSFFEVLAKEIMSVQTKLDKLYALKKTMLVKMFPQGDAIVPEIRLKGFNGEWSDSTLGHCFDERRQRDSTGELLSVTIADGVIRFSESGRTDNSSSDKSNYKKVEINDIAYNSMRMWQGACGRSLYSGIVSPAYTVLTPRSNTDSLFFAYLFKNPYLLHQFRIHSQGLTSDTWNLRFPAFSKIKIRKPHVNEQIAIGRYFQTLDKQLHLYEQKLSKLKNLKSAFLKNMFV